MYAETPISLTPKAYQTLLVLLKHHGETVEKEFLLNEVWADTFVEETTLAQNILTLRKTLGRYQNDKEFIVTFPRRGYRFVGEVREIFNHEEIIVVEKRTRTHIIAEQKRIHDSTDTDIIVNSERHLIGGSFVSTKPFSVALLVLLALAIGYLVIFGFTGNKSFADAKFQKISVETIVADADIRNAIASPNGKYLAVIQVKNETQSLNLRQIESGNSVEIVPKINGNFIGASFSPDNEHIFYSVNENAEPNKSTNSTLYKVSIHGGASQEILHNLESVANVSPDKTRLSFIRRNPKSKETALIIVDIDGKNERSLVICNPEIGFTNAGASWSPDGKFLSATVNRVKNNKLTVQVVVVNSETGEQKIISDEDWISAGQTAWLKDGSGVVVIAYGAKSPSLNDEIWVVSNTNGKARFVTNGINGIYGISLNTESNSIVAVKSNKFACFLTAAVDNLHKNTHVLTTISDECLLPFGADWTNEGTIIYSATDNGNADIYTISEDGSQRKQLTSDASAEISPKLSADGKFMIFMSNRSGQMNVWRSDANGTNAIQLTENGNVEDSIISPDGNTVFYIVQDSESSVETLWRVSINGGEKIQMTSQMTKSPRISPDGKTIACYFLDSAANKMKLALLSSETGSVVKFPATPQNDGIPFLDWSKDGENLFIVLQRGKPSSFWKLPLNGNQPEELREWENDEIFRLAISRNGERVFYEVGNELNSVVEIKSL